MRRASKVDTAHAPIVDGLRGVGAFVQSLAPVGGGCPDLLVRYRGKWFVMEVKTGGKRLRKNQEAWWRKTGMNVYTVVISAEDALRVIGALK